MAPLNVESNTEFVRNAIASFDELISKKKDVLEGINRKNKGELFVLNYLSTRDEPVLPSELSAALHSSMARISALLRSLEKKGQIERDVDRSNRRNILVTITESGRERAIAEIRGIDQLLAEVFIEMGDTDTAEFLRLLEVFLGIVQTRESGSENQRSKPFLRRLFGKGKRGDGKQGDG